MIDTTNLRTYADNVGDPAGTKIDCETALVEVADLLDALMLAGTIWGGTSGGSSNAYTITPSPALASLEDGHIVSFIANHTNTGAATLNPSALGATSIVHIDGSTALVGGEIQSGDRVICQYDGTSYRLIDWRGYRLRDYGAATNTTNDTVASSSYADLSGMSISKTIKATDIILLLANFSYSINATATDTAAWRFLDTLGPTDLKAWQANGNVASTGGVNQSGSLHYIGPAAAGSNTFKLQHVRVTGSSTIYTKNKSMSLLIFGL